MTTLVELLRNYELSTDYVEAASVDAPNIIERQAAQIEMMRSTLHGIVDADWRKWEELASPEEFVRWAKSRANHVLSTTPDQALEQFAVRVREQCIGVCYEVGPKDYPNKLITDGYVEAIRAIKELP